jgi:hypothetical protein
MNDCVLGIDDVMDFSGIAVWLASPSTAHRKANGESVG